MKYEDIQDYKNPWVGLTEEEVDEIYTSVQEEVNKHWDKGGTTMFFPFTLYKALEQALKEKNMKSEQIIHSLSVGPKSIQSRVFDRETDEVISFVKIPIKDSGLVRCTHPVKDLEDIDINITWNENSMRDFGKDELNFARAILRKAQEK